MIVVKFGGSVLNSADGLRRACDEVQRLGGPLLVVVSAFADVTNRLERIAELAVADREGAHASLDELMEHHRVIARDALADDAYTAWLVAVEPYAGRLREVVDGLAIVRDLTPRTLDLAVHFGERLSSSLVHAALSVRRIEGARGVALVGALDVIITDAGFRYARPDMALTRRHVDANLRPALAAGDVVVTEGYIARSTTGQATTMGRESSDYSATLLGELLGAERVTIYTSLPGILTADPRLVRHARTLPKLSYGMANALAELGAKVLHPRTVSPAESAGMPLVITSIGGAETTIGHEGCGGCSIVLLPNGTLITAETATASGPAEPFVRAIAAQSPVVWHRRFRRRLQVLAVARAPHHGLPTHLLADALAVESRDVAVVSLVREEIADGGTFTAFFEALGGRVPLAVEGAIDGRAISVAIDRDDAEEVLHALHRRFVETAEGAERWLAPAG